MPPAPKKIDQSKQHRARVQLLKSLTNDPAISKTLKTAFQNYIDETDNIIGQLIVNKLDVQP